MNEQSNNMRVLFTAKAESALNEIIKKNNLEETSEELSKKINAGRLSNEVAIDYLAKSFSVGKISEKDFITNLQISLGVPLQVAEKIYKDIITNIIPFIEKIPEEKFKDPVFREEISKKIFGESADQAISSIEKVETPQETANFIPKIKLPEDAEATPEKNSILPKKQRKIERPTIVKGIEKIIPQSKQSKGPDSYREPIE